MYFKKKEEEEREKENKKNKRIDKSRNLKIHCYKYAIAVWGKNKNI